MLWLFALPYRIKCLWRSCWKTIWNFVALTSGTAIVTAALFLCFSLVFTLFSPWMFLLLPFFMVYLAWICWDKLYGVGR